MLKLSRGYQGVCAMLAIFLDLSISAVFGLRGWYLLIALLVCWFPTYVVVIAFAVRIVPQKVLPAPEAEPDSPGNF
jgi:hypothetical protein